MNKSIETHVKTLGWLYIIMGAFGLIIAGCIFTIVFGAGLISGDRTAITATFIVSAIIGAILLVLSLPEILTGVGLLNYKSWARILALVLGVLNLPNFPLGTALGVYTLYALLDDEAAIWFNSR